MSYQLHVVGLPHNSTNVAEHNFCAFGAKAFYFCKMMTSLGINVFHYGGPDSNPDCTEHISLLSKEEQVNFFGDYDQKKQMYPIRWDTNELYWKLTNARAVIEICKRLKPNDKICYVGGGCHSPIANALSQIPIKHQNCEPFCGYQGIFTPYVAYETATHAARVYSIQRDANGNLVDPNGRNFDAIIPVYNDKNNFPFYPLKEDYFAFVGRLIIRKGINTAVEVANETGTLLRIAGQGVKEYKNNPPNSVLVGDEETYKGNFEYIGTVNEAQRAELLGRAMCGIMPTSFLEPGQNTQMECRMAGTPFLGTPWGAAACDVKHGKTGYLCRTLEQFCWGATDGLEQLWTPEQIRNDAIERHDIENIKYRFKEWFDQMDTLLIEDNSNNGWYHKNPDRKTLKYVGV